ncbi:hypothetical protein G5C51_40135, partial [Streptomyces sp. A7024]|nr:hypothetical protein [Streptomyces coryli]
IRDSTPTILVASEPDDGSEDWRDLPDRTLLTATLATGVRTEPVTPIDATDTRNFPDSPDADERARAA